MEAQALRDCCLGSDDQRIRVAGYIGVGAIAMTDMHKGKKPVRYRTCDECDGRGRKKAPAWYHGPKKTFTCEECDGKGKKPVYCGLWDEDDDWLR